MGRGFASSLDPGDPDRRFGGLRRWRTILDDAPDAVRIPLQRWLTAHPSEVVGVGLATVDAERAVEALGPLGFEPAADDEALAARALAASPDDGEHVVILEPRAEGRLTAFLARHGEGLAVLYVRRPDARSSLASFADGTGGAALDTPARASEASEAADPGTRRDSPLGPARLRRPLPRSGPFILEIATASSGPIPSAASERVPSGSMVEPALSLRPALAGDADAIAALFTDEGYPAGPSDILERLARFDSDYSTVRVAEIAGEVVGFVAVHVMPRFEHGDRIARVLALVVDPGVRERGLGHALMGEAERLARETGCAFIEVTAGHHRPDALQLYEALGYDPGVAAYLRKRL